MAGEDPNDTVRADPEESKKLFSNKPAWQRFLVAFSGPMFSILGGYLLLALSTSIWGLPSIGIDRVDIGGPAYEAGIEAGDQITHIDGRRIMDQGAFSTAVQRMDDVPVTVLRGSVGSIDITVSPGQFPMQTSLILETPEMLKPTVGDKVTHISEIPIDQWMYEDASMWVDKEVTLKMEGQDPINAILRGVQHIEPRRAVGIVYASVSNRWRSAIEPFQAEDTLLAINGVSLDSSVHRNYAFLLLANMRPREAFNTYLEIRGDTVIDALSLPGGQTAQFTVRRDGRQINLSLSITQLADIFQQSIFYPALENWYPEHVFQAFSLGFQRASHLLLMMGTVLGDLFSGRTGAGEFVGVVGLTGIVGQAARAGMEMVFFLVAFITLNLGIINLLPLPALDGGRIVFAVIEMVFRKKVNPMIENYIHAVGFFLLMGLIIFITYNDIMRFIR